MEADEYYYWCFVCKKECLVIDSDNDELQCDRCFSTFVEELPNKKTNLKNQTTINQNNIEYANSEEKKKSIDHQNFIKNPRTQNIIENPISLNNNLESNLQNSNANNQNPNLIDVNINNFSNIPQHPKNGIDDPRNFNPVMNFNNLNRFNNGISSVSFSNQGGNALIQMQINGIEQNENTGNLNSGISNMINSFFSAISGNVNSNIVNISNNSVSFNLTGLLGNHANSLVQGLQSIDLNSILGRNINDNAFENILNIIMRSDRGSPPASEDVIKSLERIEINDENYKQYSKDNCVICADDFVVNQKLIHLNCSHFFHEECLTTWLRKRNQCPICRKELKTDDEDYEKRRSENRTILNNLMRSNSNNDNNNDENGNSNVG